MSRASDIHAVEEPHEDTLGINIVIFIISSYFHVSFENYPFFPHPPRNDSYYLFHHIIYKCNLDSLYVWTWTYLMGQLFNLGV